MVELHFLALEISTRLDRAVDGCCVLSRYLTGSIVKWSIFYPGNARALTCQTALAALNRLPK